MPRRTPKALRFTVIRVNGKLLADKHLQASIEHAQKLDRIVASLRGVVTTMIKTLDCTHDEAIDLLTPMVREADALGYEKRVSAAIEKHAGRDVLARVRVASRSMSGRPRRTLERGALRTAMHRARKASANGQ